MNPEREQNRKRWLYYLSERIGTYEYRTRRYGVVADELERLGLIDNDLVIDIGAGMCEFARYLFSQRNWSGRYMPVDGSIDGTELEEWNLNVSVDFLVAIEVIEHLADIDRMFAILESAKKGAVITTPNPEYVDVLSMDRTHKTEITQEMLEARGWEVKKVQLFNDPLDSLVGIYRPNS